MLQQLKALCDGKQSCRFNTSHPVFTRPAAPGCGGVGVPLSTLRLAVRASGCQLGTGSGIILNFRERHVTRCQGGNTNRVCVCAFDFFDVVP